MHVLYVIVTVLFVLKHPRANVTLESLDVTNTMNSRQMTSQVSFVRKFPTANLALVPGVRMFWFGTAATLSMRRVVVSADR